MDKKLIFISHAESDKEIANNLVELVLAALELEDGEVRCTSVPGYKLPFGKLISPQIKKDVTISAVIIALITEKSLQSKWVLFELGASWALDKTVISILAPGLTESDLPGPLQEYRCIKVDSADASSDLIDAFEQVASKLSIPEKTGSKRQAKLEEFVVAFKSYKPASSHAETNGAIEDVSVRAEKELENLVSPLYSKVFKDESGEYKGVNYIFMKGSPGYVDSRRPRDREFFEFWQSIKQNMYLAQGDLYSSLVAYLDKKSNTVGDDGHDDMLYLKAEKELIEAISKRYFELLAKIKPT